MARTSLIGLLMGLGGQSCLITSNPELDPPTRTPPILLSVNPPTYQVYTVTIVPGATTRPTISFDVISEDLGQPIRGVMYIDFQGWEQPHQAVALIRPNTLPLGHLGSQPNIRQGSAEFSLPTTPGCHSATLVLSHEIDPLGNPPNRADTATATWYYYLASDDPTNVTVQGCASGPAPLSGDAGRDGAPE
jgi:hypothetical protein